MRQQNPVQYDPTNLTQLYQHGFAALEQGSLLIDAVNNCT
jgi:hypothetical protein